MKLFKWKVELLRTLAQKRGRPEAEYIADYKALASATGKIVTEDGADTEYWVDEASPENAALHAKYRAMRPPEPIPDDFDPAQEKRRLRSGGCCGQPSKGGDE